MRRVSYACITYLQAVLADIERYRGKDVADAIRGALGSPVIVCEPPRRACRCRRGCDKVERVEWRSWPPPDEKRGWIRLSSRWAPSCGTVNRVYLTPDGSIVISHDDAAVEAATLIVPATEAREKLATLYRRLAQQTTNENRQ